VSSVTEAPHISQVDPESVEFRGALAKAGGILVGTGLNVYSRHCHYALERGEVLFEELVMPGKLALYPLQEAEAAAKGLPSCWAFTPDGDVVVLRYADRRLHDNSDLNVTSPEFQTKLMEIGRAFACAGLHDTLELNAAGYLFSGGSNRVTLENTDEGARRQEVTLVEPTAKMVATGWTFAACWGFSPSGEAVATGFCNDGQTTRVH